MWNNVKGALRLRSLRPALAGSGQAGQAFLVAVLWSSWAFGVGTKFWTSATFEDFGRGNFSGISLSREGALQLAPALEEVFNSDQAMIWAVARDTKGNLYLGTGHSGKVFRLGPDLKSSLVFDAAEPDVFALAVDKDGYLYVGTSPEGKIYKVDPAGKAQELFNPQAKYIWAMEFGTDGALYVGTGDRGKIYRIRPNGEGELFYDTQQTHVVSLAVSRNSELIAGTEPNGLLYRVSSAGRGFVIYDAPLAEIHSVTVAADGSIYASAMGGSEDRRLRLSPAQPPGGQGPVRTSTTITVRAADEPPFPPGGAGDEGGQQDPQRPDGGAAQVTVGVAQPGFGTGITRLGEGRNVRSSLFRVWPDSTVETLWNSTRESVFDLLVSGKNLLFSTDDKGRIYELTPDRQVSLVTQTGQEQTTRLIPFDNFVLATTANVGKVFRMGTRPAPTGFFESEVYDAGNIASWGKIRWTVEAPPGTSLEMYTRTGNSRRPDATWSDWSPAYRQATGEQISGPAARYVQWKAALHSSADRSPVLREVILAYLTRNRAPEVQEVRVTPRGERGPSGSATPGITVISSGGGSAGPRAFSGLTPARSSPPRGQDIRWTANDPDQDELAYALYFRGEGEAEWKLLQEDWKTNSFQLDNDVLPDGRYRLKVVASDAQANPAGMSKTAEMVSAPFLVDNTPPRVEVVETGRGKDSATARFRAFDAASVLTRAEYAVDADPLAPLLSEDGITDSREEAFTVTVNQLDGREHLLTLRVYDSAGNVGVGKTVWPAPGTGAER